MTRARTVLFASSIALTFFSVAPAARADDAACVDAAEKSISDRDRGALQQTLKDLAVCADPSCPTEVKEECARRIAAATAAVPTIILSATDPAGNDLSDVTVSLDDAPIATSLDGRAISIDPGKHVFRFEAKGQPPVVKELVLREGQKDRRESVVIGTVAPPPKPPAPTAPPSKWNTQKTLGVAAGGAGIVGIGIGAVFGAFAISAHNKETSDCGSSGCPNRPQSTEDYNAANKDATASTIAFIAGGVFVAAGAVLYFTAPTNKDGNADHPAQIRIAPSVGANGAGIVIGGAL